MNSSDRDGAAFNVEFLGVLIACGTLSIVFLLYFNRVFASLLSWGLRVWVWHQYRVYIDFQALQVSLFGGRVFFTGLRYHGNNETIFVQNGYITWSYWLRWVKEINVGKAGKATPPSEQLKDDRASKLPCRIDVSLLGLEWFIYNRSPAYDSILSGLTEDATVGDPTGAEDVKTAEESLPNLKRRRSGRFGNSEDVQGGVPSQWTESSGAAGSEEPRGFSRQHGWSLRSSGSENGKRNNKETGESVPDLPLMLQLFPIYLECNKAALVMGNENTRSILTVKTESLSGEIGAAEAPTCDPYRQVFRIDFKHPVIQMTENMDFKEEQADRACREKQTSQQPAPTHSRSFFRQQRRKILGQLRNLLPYWRKSVESFSMESIQGNSAAAVHMPGSNHWQGLSRYLGDDMDDQRARWASVEYAALPTVLDSPAATLTIFWDVPGKVRPSSDACTTSGEKSVEQTSNINGAESPAWAINLALKGGSVNYGPWADRQRAELQRTFAPALCKDAVPAQRLAVGADRVPTQFKLYVELKEEVTLRVPVREESKNWRWKGQEPVPKQGPNESRKSRARSKKSDKSGAAHQRPYGWLDIKVAADATISYSMDMVAGLTGFSNTLNLDLPGTEISSSINHELLWKSGKLGLNCDLSTPLNWNGLRQWHFNVISDGMELFLLRDHVFLLTDLVDDWASGPPAEYLVFTPFKYHLDLRLNNVKLHLNVNDANIINNPTDLEDNTYISISSPSLQSTTCIPMDTYRPSRNAIPFDIRADTASVALHIPPWSTQASFLDSSEVGQVESLVVDGSYHYNATTSHTNTDTLILNLGAQSPVVRLHGFVLRYFLKVKDNYFGEDVHFKTLEEYQTALRLKETNPEADQANKPPHKKSNEMDVMLNIRVDDPKVFLPSNLYSSRRHIQIDTASLGIDLRFTNYYMDLDLSVTPLNLSLSSAGQGWETPMSSAPSTQLFIDRLNIYGNRLFGLPPTEPTYLCNWDISVGAIKGECSVDFVNALANGGKAFIFSFEDDENALVSFSSILFWDVTFLRAFVESVNLWIHVEEAAFLLSTGTIEVNYNDWARTHYSKRSNIKIPDIKLSCVSADSATRHKSRLHQSVDAEMLVQTSVHLATIGRKVHFSEERKRQQELVRHEDQRTHRTPFLLLPNLLDELVAAPVDPLSQSVPPIPQPTTAEDLDDPVSFGSGGTSRRSRGLRHKSSFLSFASSSGSSVIKPRSSRRSSVKTRATDLLHPFTSFDQSHGSTKGPSSAHMRELSASTRHSAFYSATGEHADRHDGYHNTVAFSSQYFAPYFPMENVQPSTKEALLPSIEHDDDEDEDEDDGDGAGYDARSVGFNLEDVDPNLVGEDCLYSSTMVELPEGVTAFLTPTSLKQIAALLSALQPSDPEDMLDNLQTGSMGEIFNMQKEQKVAGHVADLLVRLPRTNIRFVNTSDLDSANPPEEEQDQYDIGISKLAFAFRADSKWEDAFKPETRQTRNSFHLRLHSVALSAAERLKDMVEPQAAVSAQIERVMVSMGSKDVTYIDVDVGNIQGSTSSKKIEYLASLIHRTSFLASELETVFGETKSRETRLMKFLTHRLITEGQQAPDPVFLTRPSAVLRSVPHHLRTFDSWKLIMRLRQLWTVLSPSAKEQLRFRCLGGDLSLPPDLKQDVFAAFEKWRSWDLENLSDSVLLHKILGQAEKSKPPMPESAGGQDKDKPILAVVRVKQLQLALDPGPKQNEVTLLDLTARLEMRNPTADDQVLPGTEPDVPLTVLNLYCSGAAINLNWELCELADDVLKLVKRMQTRPSLKGVSQASGVAQEDLGGRQPQNRAFHCVMSLGQGSVAFDAINLHASSHTEEIKISLLSRTGKNDSVDTNLIFSCDTVTSRLQSHSQKLAKFMLYKPSILLSHELHSTSTTESHTVKATASSDNLSLTVRQDPIALLEILDLVVRDEVAQLYRLKDQFPLLIRSSSSDNTVFTDRLSVFRVNMAMFMDQYTISVPLLRSLTYTIRGTVARAAMAAHFGSEIIFDFDVKENMHDMQVRVNNVDRSISLMRIPPTNGRVSSHMDQGKHSLGVFASVELIELDASAVYSLLSALNRPEVSNSINELQQQAKVIQDHTQEIFGREQPPGSETAETTPDALAYSVHLTFAGLRVFGNSPIKSASAPTAHILFWLDSVHVEMANWLQSKGPILDYPELHVNLRHIVFELLKGNNETMNTCGKVAFGALITATSTTGDDGKEKRFFNVKSESFEVNLSPDTISTVVDVLGYMGDKIKDLDTSRELEYLRRLRQSKPRIAINDEEEADEESDIIDTFFSSITYTFVVCNIQVVWIVTATDEEATSGKDDLVFALEKIELGTRTRNSARLTIENLLVQMVPPRQENRLTRSSNSALLPEVIFNIAYVSTPSTRRMAFQAVGKSLDLRLTPGFIIPAANLSDSIGLSVQNARDASQQWNPVIPATSAAPSASTSPTAADEPRRTILGQKRLESLLVDADFAGAVVYVTGKRAPDDLVSSTRASRPPVPGKPGQDNTDETLSSTVLRSPGLAWKIEFRDHGREDPSLHAEVKIDASSNILYPSVVPLIVDISNSVKEVVSSRGDKDKGESLTKHRDTMAEDKPKFHEEESNLLTVDPSAVLGRTRLNLGLRICRQEFSLSCQPIARVAATASFDDVYFTVNTVRSVDQGNFFAISGAFTKLQASVQHVYSRESTGSFEVESIVLSLMNSKHVSGVSGVSAILKFSPMKVSINAKQLQDFMLFREIWMPPEVTQAETTPAAKLNTETSQGHLAQRYQQVAATAAFPWTATVSITALEIGLDLGQAIGKATFAITDFWVSSKKTSDWEQNLCLGFREIGVESAGRMSGFVALQDFKLRTWIQWPEREQALNETPLIQATVDFSQLRVKAAFDYQAFLIADITSMDFLMYNVRRSHEGSGDRLVAIFDGDAVQVFGTTTSAAQGIALFQAFQRLVQERKAAFERSLKEIERFMRRKSVGASAAVIQRLTQAKAAEEERTLAKSPISLDTDVVVTLKALNLGVFPSTFSDHQVLKMEALNAQARFAASVEDDGRIHSILGLTLGQLRIGLAGVRSPAAPKALSELSVEDVVQSATGSRGGTIVKVPQVEAIMQTWQRPSPSNQIDYIFKTAFEGKIDVGWNWSRISFIRGMWANHQRALELIWGKELPSVTSIRVTGVPEPSTSGPEGAEVVLKEEPSTGDEENGERRRKSKDDGKSTSSGDEQKQAEPQQQQKITAEVKVPQSKYEYTALEPPVIETPQLRDMGEATPPLEWIGLHRDRLPNLTHQVVIVSLLELAGEVEDAYSRILGST